MARPVRAWVSIFPLDGTGKCSLEGTKPPVLQKVRADPHLEHRGGFPAYGGAQERGAEHRGTTAIVFKTFPPFPSLLSAVAGMKTPL